jgi:hypothetical protein
MTSIGEMRELDAELVPDKTFRAPGLPCCCNEQSGVTVEPAWSLRNNKIGVRNRSTDHRALWTTAWKSGHVIEFCIQDNVLALGVVPKIFPRRDDLMMANLGAIPVDDLLEKYSGIVASHASRGA